MGEHDPVHTSVVPCIDKKLPGIPGEGAMPGLRQRIRKICIHLWIWELLSLCLCTSCIGAIIIILARYDGLPSPEWNYGLTINGVISVLAGIAKASMILPIAESISQLKWHWFWNSRMRPAMDFEHFDIASRGPWGCFMLLCRPRQWSLVSLGALVTVLALLMEPSLQFIPSYPLKQTDTGRAWVPRSAYYNDVAVGSEVNSTAPNGLSPTYNLGSASKNGLFNVLYGTHNQSTYAITPTCPTGNCTWPNYRSLAICSSCTNLTSELDWKGFEYNNMGWTLPNGLHSYAPYYTYMVGDENTGKYPSLAYNQTISQNVFTSFIFDNEEVSDLLTRRKPVVYECALYVCLKTYSGRMRAGVFSEHVNSAWPGPHEELPGGPDLTSEWTADVANVSDWGLHPPGTDDVYRVNVRTVVLLKAWLASKLADSVAWASSEANHGDLDTGQAINLLRKGHAGDGSYPAKRVMDAIADSLTLAVRTVADAKDAAAGTSQENRAFLKARWWFAILPIALVTLTCSFMAATLFVTLRHNVPVWKSSALATLAHGLQDESSVDIMADKLDLIEHRASGQVMTVKTSTQRQWRFVASRAER